MKRFGNTLGLGLWLLVVVGCRSAETPLQYGDGEYLAENPEIVGGDADTVSPDPRTDIGQGVADIAEGGADGGILDGLWGDSSITPWDVGGAFTDVVDTGGALPDVAPDVPEVIEQGPVPDLRVATWNLRNFSDYGPTDYRVDAIADKIKNLSPDILALQELRPKEGSNGMGDQAFDALLDQLPGYEGTHVTWDSLDTSVGIIYRTDVASLVAKKTIFANDSWAFPRPPLVATLTVMRDGASVNLTVVVIHLKAYDDSADRRKEACEKLYAWLDAQPTSHHILIGDFNDDPHDVPKDNVFLGTFLEMEPQYYFVTDSFPPKTVTSIGWFHYVDGDYVKGQFIDHAIVQGDLFGLYDSVVPSISGVSPNKFDDWGDQYSDHFPVYVDFIAPDEAER